MTERDPFDAELEELRAENAELRAANKLLRTAYLVPEDKVLLAENERLQNLILGACDIFCNLDAPHWAAEFRRALEQGHGRPPQT